MKEARFPPIWRTLALFCLASISAFAGNPIQNENANPGTSAWQLTNPAVNREIEGYASLTSVNIGSPITFFVSTSDPTFHVDVFRTGWYGGLGARLTTTITGLPGTLQTTPDPDPVTGVIDCKWKSSYTLSVPTTWISGIFLARLTGDVSGKQSYIIFVVRDDQRSSDLVFQSSVTTFEAYNFWPGGGNGKSLYSWAPGGRAWEVSFNRPYVLGYSYTPQSPGAASGVGAGEYLANLQPGPDTTGYPIPAAGFEYNMVRWLEKNGYDVTYITNIDMHENGALLKQHKAYLSVGHNEYWSMPMVQNLQSAMNAGVNAGFFGANTMYWQIRLQQDSLGKADRIIVCYKTDAAANDPMYSTNPTLATVTFRSSPVNLPEAAVVGVEYVADPVTSDIVISNASHWLMNGTGLKNGDHLQGLLGYEVDSSVRDVSPANTAVLASSPIGFPEDIDDPSGFDCQSVECESNVTWYSAANYSVFATGSMFWSWGLDDFNAPSLRPSYLSAPAQQITKNVLSALINSVVITTATLPTAVVGTAYSSSISATDGGPPYSWSAVNLPAGMTFSTSGVLSGTPTATGTASITFSVQDSAGHTGTASLALVIQSSGSGSGTGGAPSITTGTLPYAAVGAAFQQSLAGSGGTAPYTWSLVSGSLPTGLALSSAGQITGTATHVGVFPFTVKLTDAAAGTVTSTLQIVSIGTVDAFLTTAMDTTKWCACVLDQAAGSQSSKVSVQQQNGQLSITPRASLSGMNYNGYGSLSGLNMTDAVLSVQAVQVTTGNGSTDTSFALALDTNDWYRFIVEGGNLYLQAMVAGVKSGTTIAYIATNDQYWRFRHNSASSQMFFETSSTGLAWTTQWQTAAAVPVTSLFVGLDAGTWASDQNVGEAIFANLRWEQNSGPVLPYITAATLSSGTAGGAYTGQLSAVSGTSPYQWSIVSGSLPAGCAMSSSGALSGVPTTSGTFTFTAQVSDSNSLMANQNYSVTVNPSTALTISTTSLPAGTVNTAYSQTLTATGGIAPYTWSASSLPAGMTFSAAAVLSGRPTAAGTVSITFSVKDSAGHSATASLSLVIQSSGSGPPSIVTSTLPYAVVGAAFTQSLAGSGGTPPYTWSVATGSLPTGLALSSAGQITGTATHIGVFPFTVQLTDAAAHTVTGALQIVSIGAADSFLTTAMDTTKWCACVLDQAAGSQSSKVSVQQQNGELSITPKAGVSGINYNGYGSLAGLNMTDAVLSVQAVQVTAGDGSTDTSFALALDTNDWYRFIVEGGNLYLQAMVAGVKSGTTIPYNSTNQQYWRFRHNSASSQMFFETSSTGLAWTTQWQTAAAVPVASLFIGLDAGTWASDQNTGQAAFSDLRWEQNSDPALPYITATALSSGTVGSAYTGQLSVTSGTSPYQWSVVNGSLPAGLALSSSGGLSGVPTASGTSTFTAQVGDSNSLMANQNYSVTVNPSTALTISTTSLPAGTVNTAYSQTLTATGGIAPYTWSASSLPAGMTFSAAAVLSGRPTAAGTVSITFSVKDSAGHSATASLSLVIQSSGSGPPSIVTSTLPYAVVGAAFTQSLAGSGGTPPYTWSVATGSLPTGLALSSAGQITGTATHIGVFPFTVQLTDAAAHTVTGALQIVSIGAADSFLTTAMDTTKWCACVLDQATGSQSSKVSVQQQGNGQLSITPKAGVSGMIYNGYGSLTGLNMTDAVLSVQAVQVTTGNGSTDTSFALALDTNDWYRFIVEGGNLYLQAMVAGVKSGTTIAYIATNDQYWRFRHSSASGQMFFETSSTGLAWTTQWQTAAAVPVASLFIGLDAGTWVSDQNTGQAVFSDLRWEQNSDPVLPYISANALSSGTVGSAYTGQLSAVSGTSPYQWSVVNGSLPAGLALSSSGGLSGVPTASGTFTFTAQVSDGNSLTANQSLQITVH